MVLDAPEHILITGASSGIGAALARHYAAALPGVRLSLGGRNAERLERTAADCRTRGSRVSVGQLDVVDRDKVREWVIAMDESAAVDLVIANAGISGGTGNEMESAAQTRAIFDVNLTGVLNTVEPAIDRMVGRGRGQIALVSSLAGYRGWPGAPAYCGSKAAVKVYGEALRGALRGAGVSVNVVCPGFIKSPMTDVNAFPMPFLMDADRAAGIIASGLARDKGRIAFPWQMAALAWLGMALPDAVVQRIALHSPAKAHAAG